MSSDRRRTRRTAEPLDLVLADADPAEREQLAAALARLHELLVRDRPREVRTLASERADS